MVARQIRRIPAVVLIVLLSILTLRAWLDAGDDPLTVSPTTDGLTSVTWAASVSATGRLAISVRYVFADAVERRLDVYVPDGARFLRIDGTPVSASNGTSATAQVSSSATVAYELPGAVTRYRDGALLRLVRINGTSLDGNQGLFSCPRCLIDPIGYGDTPVYGALAVPGAGEVHPEFIGLHSVRVAADRNEMRFVGIDASTGDVAMIAVLPAEAVSGLPVGDGTVGQAVAAVKSELKPSEATFHSPHRPVHGEQWAAVALTVMLGLIVVWIAARLIWAIGSRAATRAARPLAGHQAFADARSVRPTDLEPALAGAIVGGAVKGERSVVAATIVELARRNVLEFTGNDSRRFSLVVPVEATGSTRFEQDVIDSLRLDDEPPVLVERTSPHLWGERSGEATKRLRKALLKATLREKLVRVSVPAVLLVPLTIVMGTVAILGTTGGVKFAWFVAVVGPLLALATVASAGLVLTAKGRTEQAQWTEYAAWLHTNDYLAQAEPWAVSDYGEILAYAAALGAAPEVVRCLSPDRKKRI